MKEWVWLSEFEIALDEQMEKVKQIAIRSCPMLRCNLSFIDEWDHRWGYHPDSSSHLWTLVPDATAFLKSTVQTMAVRKEQDSLDEDQKKSKRWNQQCPI